MYDPGRNFLATASTLLYACTFPEVCIFMDEFAMLESLVSKAAHAGLTRVRSPWLVQRVKWDPHLVLQAVIWLARTLNKAILRLTEADYRNNSLHASPSPTPHLLPRTPTSAVYLQPRLA